MAGMSFPSNEQIWSCQPQLTVPQHHTYTPCVCVCVCARACVTVSTSSPPKLLQMYFVRGSFGLVSHKTTCTGGEKDIHITCIPSECTETNLCERAVWCDSIKCSNTLATQKINKDMYCPFLWFISESAAHRQGGGGGGGGGEGCRYRGCHGEGGGKGVYSRRTLNDCARVRRGGFLIVILSAPFACWNTVFVV